jgi:hypothetical protein
MESAINALRECKLITKYPTYELSKCHSYPTIMVNDVEDKDRMIVFDVISSIPGICMLKFSRFVKA